MEDYLVKKYLIIFIMLTILLSSMLFLTSCSTDNVNVTYNIDTGTINIVVPRDIIDGNYVPQIKAINIKQNDDYATISIELSKSEEEDVAVFISSVKNELSKVVPSFANIKDKFNIEVTRDYFGSSISGTTYYKITVKNETGIDIPVKFISEKPFLINGSSSEKNEDLFEKTITFSNSSDIAIHELQYVNSHIEAIKITIDISDDTPSIEYDVSHTLENINADLIASELKTYGMHVTYCKDSSATFSESYDTNNDFQHAFPMQLYSVFGIVNTVKYNYGEFFTSEGSFELKLIKVPIDNVTIVIVGQDNTTFELIDGDTTYTETGDKYTFVPKDGMVVKASYNNARWFAAFTSLFTILAIVFVMFGMFYIVKKRNRGGLYYGN
jgi:hypothetical protein